MRVTFRSEELRKAYKRVSVSLPSRSVAIPIIENILIRSEGGNLIVSATNLDTVAVAMVEGAMCIGDDFSVAVSPKVLMGILKTVNDAVDMVVSDEYGVQIKLTGSQYDIPGMNGDDFPTIPEMPVFGDSINPDELINGLGKTINLATDDPDRPSANGISMSPTGYVCLFDQEAGASCINPCTITGRLEGRNAISLVKWITGLHSDIQIGITDSFFHLKDGDNYLSMRKVDVPYRNIFDIMDKGGRVIPYDSFFAVAQESFLDTVNRLKALSSDMFYALNIEYKNQGEIILTLKDHMSHKSGREVLPVHTQFNDQFSINLNINVVSSLLAQVNLPEVRIHIDPENVSIAWFSIGEEERHIITALNL